MEHLKFKTTLQCEGCVSKIKTRLDALTEIKEWKVAVDTPQKTLEVKGVSLDAQKIKQLIEDTGFEAELI